jgi:diguanylate cyclase (GGDEF)-like protein
MNLIDARLRELQFLSKLDLDGGIKVNEAYDGSPERQMIISLVYNGYINDIDTDFRFSRDCPGGLEQAVKDSRMEDIYHLRRPSGVTAVNLYISHKGRVRLSELKQQLKTGRDRDESGLLWDKRHLLTDLSIELLSADKSNPLYTLFLDMNGLKAINDVYGHQVGDEAIRAFFRIVVATFGERAECYRNGGDEVVVLLSGVDDERLRVLFRQLAEQLDQEILQVGADKTRIFISASCGAISTLDRNANALDVLAEADAVQYRAKEKSKIGTKRVTTSVIGKSGAIVVHEF